jgi:hypothetical protein
LLVVLECGESLSYREAKEIKVLFIILKQFTYVYTASMSGYARFTSSCSPLFLTRERVSYPCQAGGEVVTHFNENYIN